MRRKKKKKGRHTFMLFFQSPVGSYGKELDSWDGSSDEACLG
jgi:hypothetical protein